MLRERYVALLYCYRYCTVTVIVLLPLLYCYRYCTVTVIVLLPRSVLYYVFAVTLDTTGQRFYLDVFLQLCSFSPVHMPSAKCRSVEM